MSLEPGPQLTKYYQLLTDMLILLIECLIRVYWANKLYKWGGQALGGYSKARHALEDYRSQGERMYGKVKKDVPELGL